MPTSLFAYFVGKSYLQFAATFAQPCDQFKLSLLYKIDQMELKIHESLEIDHGLQLDEQFLIDHVISQRKSNIQWMISVVFVVLSLFGIAVITRLPKLK